MPSIWCVVGFAVSYTSLALYYSQYLNQFTECALDYHTLPKLIFVDREYAPLQKGPGYYFVQSGGSQGQKLGCFVELTSEQPNGN